MLPFLKISPEWMYFISGQRSKILKRITHLLQTESWRAIIVQPLPERVEQLLDGQIVVTGGHGHGMGGRCLGVNPGPLSRATVHRAQFPCKPTDAVVTLTTKRTARSVECEERVCTFMDHATPPGEYIFRIVPS